MLVHLVNYDVTLDGEITPARDLEIEVAPPKGRTVRSIEFGSPPSALDKVEIQPAGKGRGVRFRARELRVYGLAVVELQ